MKFLLILITIFLTLFKVSDKGISLTYGDYFAFAVLALFLQDYLKGRYFRHKFSIYLFFYIVILFLSAIINLTFFEGKFLNIFRTNLYSMVFFIIVYNLILQNILSPKSFVVGIGILGVTFLFKTWPEMQKAWAESEFEFTTVNIFESSLNLNSWGFCLILFLIISLYAWSIKILPKISLIYSIVLIGFIFFSYSRTVYSLTIFTIIWTIFYVNKSNVKNLIFPVVVLSIIFLFQDKLNFFGFRVSETALNFFGKKTTTYGEDLVNIRFYLINSKPILENFNSFNPLQILIGDGVSIQHSFISHTLVVTGILGFIVYIKRFWYALKIGVQKLRLKQKIISSKYLILTIFIVLVNDFITNISSFLPFSAYLSAIIIAFLFANIEGVNKHNIYAQEKSN